MKHIKVILKDSVSVFPWFILGTMLMAAFETDHILPFVGFLTTIFVFLMALNSIFYLFRKPLGKLFAIVFFYFVSLKLHPSLREEFKKEMHANLDKHRKEMG